MKFKDIILGTDKEKAAAKTAKDLSKKSTLSYEEIEQMEKVRPTLTRLRARQSLAILLAAGSVAGSVYGASQIGKSHTPKPDDQQTLEVKKFQVGPLEFIKDPTISDHEFERIQSVLSLAYPILEKYIPVNGMPGKQIKILRSDDVKNYSSYKEGGFKVTKNVSDGLIIHEFVHLLHGDNDLFYDLIEEGLAAAFSILVPEKLGLESWNRAISRQINKTASDNLYLKPGIAYNSTPGLHRSRLANSAYFWIDLEKKHPGFIRKFHDAYYKFLKEGGKKEDLNRSEILEKVLNGAELWKTFEQAVKDHKIAQPPTENTAEAEKPKIYVEYLHLTTGEKLLSIFIAKKKAVGEAEFIWQQPNIQFRFVNLHTRKVSILSGVKETGTKPIFLNLEMPDQEEGLIHTQVGVSDRYKIIIDTEVPEGKLHEEFEFDYL